MKYIPSILLFFFLLSLSSCSTKTVESELPEPNPPTPVIPEEPTPEKEKMLWFDAEANFERFSKKENQFSTNADFKVAKILANDMLSVYLMGELESLESTNLRNMVLPLPDVRPTWQDSKTDLTELIYLLDSKGCFGNVPLTQLASYISNAFNVHLDMNLSRTFCDMKIRNNPTPWLDKAKEALLKRMQTWKRNKKNGNSE